MRTISTKVCDSSRLTDPPQIARVTNKILPATGVDYVQQAMGGGDQSNESAAEQFKDEQISDAIRSKYKSVSGNDFPIEDKDK